MLQYFNVLNQTGKVLEETLAGSKCFENNIVSST